MPVLKKQFVHVFFILAFMLALSSCSGSSDNESVSDASQKAVDVSTFRKQVKQACSEIDEEVFTNTTSAYENVLADPAGLEAALQAAEGELDKVISAFDDIDPPAKYQEDWETLGDDIDAMRDAFPDLAESVTKLTQISSSLQASTDLSDVQAAQQELEDIQNNIQDISDDFAHRTEEIEKMSKKLGLTDLCTPTDI